MGWVIFIAAMAALTGAFMNLGSVLAKETPGDPPNNPYGWSGSKFWRAGAIVLVVATAVALVQAVIE